MSEIRLTAFKVGGHHKAGKAELENPTLTAPKIVTIESENIMERIPRRKTFGTVLKTSLSGKAGGKNYHVYEGVDQVSVQENPSTSNNISDDYALAVTAAGSVIGTAAALTKYYNKVSAATANTADGVQLPAPSALQKGNRAVVVRNASTAAIDVFPHGASGTIDGGASGVAVTVPAGRTYHFANDGGAEAAGWASAVLYE